MGNKWGEWGGGGGEESGECERGSEGVHGERKRGSGERERGSGERERGSGE